MRHIFPTLALLISVTYATTPCSAQYVRINIPLSITDTSGDLRVVHFGVDDRATYCLDVTLGEFEPPDVWCIGRICDVCPIFRNPNGPDTNCFGQGTFADFRKYYNPAQRDTFLLNLHTCDALYPLTIRWPDTLLQLFDSARIIDLFGGTHCNADMLSNDSLIVVSSSVESLLIFTTGPKTTSGISEWYDRRPTRFSLAQNYPNPFNPQTTIRFETPVVSVVKLELYNLLGEKVQTILNEERPPGAYTTNFPGENLASGVYFYKLTAGKFSAVKKMLLMK